MALSIALLRAVNVGGRTLLMADLRAMMVDLGFEAPRTLLQSGNLVFDAGGAKASELEQRLEAETERRFGLKADYLVRSASEWAALIAANPFPNAAKDDPAHLLAMPLKSAPAAGALDALRAAIVGREQAALHGRDLYLVYPDGAGSSKLTITVIERRLGVRGTARNWNTVGKIAALLAG